MAVLAACDRLSDSRVLFSRRGLYSAISFYFAKAFCLSRYSPPPPFFYAPARTARPLQVLPGSARFCQVLPSTARRAGRRCGAERSVKVFRARPQRVALHTVLLETRAATQPGPRPGHTTAAATHACTHPRSSRRRAEDHPSPLSQSYVQHIPSTLQSRDRVSSLPVLCPNTHART